MLRTSSVESRKVDSAIVIARCRSPGSPCTQASSCCQDRVVLPQRVALPLVRHQDPAHVRVPGEFDAEHVEHFALQPVGRQVDAGGGGGLEAVGDAGLDADALVAGKAVKDVDQFEALGPSRQSTAVTSTR